MVDPTASLNPSVRAREELNKLMQGTPGDTDSDAQVSETPAAEVLASASAEVSATPETVRADKARSEAPVLAHDADHRRARLLLITKDVSVMQSGSPTFRRITDIRNLFLEVHVILLNYTKGVDEASVMRLAENVWLYPTHSTSWWHLSYDAYKMADAQLVFSGGFRADIIVAEDLFESGLAGWFLSQKYKRPFQVHVQEDFFDENFTRTQQHPMLYDWSVSFLLDRVQSVRTKTEFQRQAVLGENPALDSATELLPNYYNLDAWRDFVPAADLRTLYPRFKFTILHVSSMRASSHSIEVLHGAAKILRRYPTIGLLIVGSGPQRPMLEKQSIALGLQKQIEFLPMPSEIISYIKTANILVHLSEDGNEDELLLAAAAAKTPLIANAHGLAGKLFVDGESARLCSADDTACIAESINRYLNENQDRARFALNAYETIFERVEQDYGSYIAAYAESIEHVMTAGN
jgi:glycosyltransferase involved in cell wall biosynthesis